jgi:hypothetical protein
MGSSGGKDITVILATYNRAEVLRETLEAFCRLDREGLAVDFVVADNNSADATRQVAERFSERLPLVYLFEPAAGKNRAVNLALDRVALGELVVFTDDDVVPARDWLAKIAEVSRRWPAYSVFGGRIDLIWPPGEVPGWARQIAREGWALSSQHLADRDGPYPGHRTPAGPNFWVRRSVFTDLGLRFNEEIGPTPDHRTRKMGSESSFLFDLADRGYPALYTPDAVVGHRVHAHLLEERDILRRALTKGRGGARILYLRDRLPVGRHIGLWALSRLARLLAWEARYLAAALIPSRDRRVLARIRASLGMGWNREYLAIAGELIRGRPAGAGRRRPQIAEPERRPRPAQRRGKDGPAAAGPREGR